MKLVELIEKASEKAGSQKALAAALSVDPPKLSEWKKGRYKPSAEAIAQMAELAGLPVFETLGEVQKELHPEAASVWARALEKLKAAGVTACAVLILGMGAGAENANADNGLASLHSGQKNIHRGKCAGRVAMRVIASMAAWWWRSRARRT